MPSRQKTFNQTLSKVARYFLTPKAQLIAILQIRVHSEHFFGSLKGRFQSLREMCFQIQNQRDLDFVNMWVQCCLILHDMILEIKEDLGYTSSNATFMEEAVRWGEDVTGSDDDNEDFIGSPGQIFRNKLMGHLMRRLDITH